MIAPPYHVVGIKEMEKSEALDILYGEEPRDLTLDGYLPAISRLRRQDRALANRVERVLKPLLDTEVFPRSGIPWQDASRGTMYRIALLGDNPHFQQDVEVIREVLAIPAGQIRSSPGDTVRTALESSHLLEVEPEEDLESIADNVLARRWIRQHERVANGLEFDQFVQGLNPEALNAASQGAVIDLSQIEGPFWLRAAPPTHSRCGWDNNLPLHWAAARLLIRHRLPQRACYPVMLYLLTTRKAQLKNIGNLGVHLIHRPGEFNVVQPANTFSITLEGLDEYSTREELDQAWEDHIRPQQRQLWEARGQAPQGRRVPSLERLRAGLPLYQASFKYRSIDAVLDHLEEIDPSWGKMEPEKARRVIMELRTLFEPQEEEQQDQPL